MNILAQLEAGNVSAVVSKLEQLFLDDVVDPIEPYVADATKIVGIVQQVLGLVSNLSSVLDPTSPAAVTAPASTPTPPASA